jgi:long-chain fatty acid transport protein
MVGYAYDKTPVPDSTIDFSLPESDKHIFSGGIKYKYDDRLTFGFSALYAKQTDRKASIYDPVSGTYTKGEFTNGGAFLMAFGIDYAY